MRYNAMLRVRVPSHAMPFLHILRMAAACSAAPKQVKSAFPCPRGGRPLWRRLSTSPAYCCSHARFPAAACSPPWSAQAPLASHVQGECAARMPRPRRPSRPPAPPPQPGTPSDSKLGPRSRVHKCGSSMVLTALYIRQASSRRHAVPGSQACASFRSACDNQHSLQMSSYAGQSQSDRIN